MHPAKRYYLVASLLINILYATVYYTKTIATYNLPTSLLDNQDSTGNIESCGPVPP